MKKALAITLIIVGFSSHASENVDGDFKMRVPLTSIQFSQFDGNGIHVSTGTRFGPDGYDVNGYNVKGYDSDNYDRNGLSPKKCETYQSGRYGASYYRSSSRGNVYSQGSYNTVVFNSFNYQTRININGKKYTHGRSWGGNCGQMFAGCKVDVCVQTFKPIAE